MCYFYHKACAGCYSVHQLAAAIGAEYTHRGCKAIGIDSLAGDDRHLKLIGQAHVRGGIDDMGIAPAIHVEVLLVIARRGHRAIGELEHARWDADLPSRLPWRRITEGEIAAGRDQSVANTQPADDREHLVGCIAFGDTAQIELHAGLIERYRAMGNVQFAITTAAGRFPQACWVR